MLQVKPGRFQGVEGRRHSLEPSKKQVVHTMFPNPVDTFGGLVTQITAVKVPAKK